MRKTVINDKNIYVMYATMRMRSKRREKENKKNAQRSTRREKGTHATLPPLLDVTPPSECKQILE